MNNLLGESLEILFRVDASIEIGTGHVMRCLALAEELRAKGANCHFVCREHRGHLGSLISERKFELTLLPAPVSGNRANPIDNFRLEYGNWLWVSQEIDAQETLKVTEKKKWDWLVVDHYGLDFRWEKQQRAYCNKIMVIDDLADRDHECDLLLDQNLVENWEDRYQGRVPMGATCLLGPKYSILQAQYAELHSSTKPRQGPVRRILVFFGGYDNYNFSQRTLKAFLSLNRPDISMDLLVSPTSVDYQTIRSLAGGQINIRILEPQPSLAPLMAQADLAIGGAGTTAWERCCLGLPSLMISVALNQIPIAVELDRLGLAWYLGHHETVEESSIRDALDKVLLEPDLIGWSKRCLGTVDGKGTKRLGDILGLCSQTELYPRMATPKDEAILLEWANDPAVRNNAFQPKPIDSKSHRNWFAEKLNSKDSCCIFIIETDLGFPIGQVRFQKNDYYWEIHYSISRIARGKGLGKKLLETAINQFSKKNRNANYIAKVLNNNIPSRKIFQSMGFEEHFESKFSVYKL